MEPRREILYCGSHLYWSNLRWLSCTRALKRWGNNTPMTASPGLACVPGIEVATSGEGVPGVAAMLLTWPSRCSWKPANRNHVNLVLQFCHVASFVLLRHPLVSIIQYHPCYRLSASGCRKFYLILQLTRKFHLTFSWTHFKIKYWWLMLGAPLVCAAQADMF